MGIGSIVFSLPQFTTGKYKIEDTGSQVICDIDANVTSTCDVENSPASLSNYKYVFYLGQLLHGAGASPLYTLGVTYLDENLPLRSSSFYIGKSSLFVVYMVSRQTYFAAWFLEFMLLRKSGFIRSNFQFSKCAYT